MSEARNTCACIVNCEGLVIGPQRCQELPWRDWGDPLAPADAEALAKLEAEQDHRPRKASEGERVMGAALLLAIFIIIAGAFVG